MPIGVRSEVFTDQYTVYRTLTYTLLIENQIFLVTLSLSMLLKTRVNNNNKKN